VRAPSEADASKALGPGEILVRRGIVASRVLLVRGFMLRLISVTTNLALIPLVVPKDLGLLALVRGTLTAAEFASELGLQLAMIRRHEDPTPRELAALTGLRTLILLAVVGLALAAPQVRSVFGLLPAEYRIWMLVTVAVTLVTPVQSACKVLLERELRFVQLSVIDVQGLLLQNLGLLAFAAAGRFGEGIFLVQMALSVYYTMALYRARPVPYFSLDVRPLRRVFRDGVGFSVSAMITVAREALTPILITHLFGLPTAGLWAFAARAGQFLKLTMEGSFRAGIAVTGRLVAQVPVLRRFSSEILSETAAITYPMLGVLYAVLPLIGLWFPAWEPAIPLAQQYLLAYGVLGVVQAALWPVAVARLGPRAAIRHEAIGVATLWTGLALLHAYGHTDLAIPLVLGVVASVGYLVAAVEPAARPVPGPKLWRGVAVLAAGIACVLASRSLGAGPTVTALLGAFIPVLALALALLRQWREPAHPADSLSSAGNA
jgi:O-antigen/teichoic acid export membrane protein